MNEPRIIWSDRARTDLAQIGDYISANNPRAAERWVERLIALVEKAAQVPMAGRVVPEFRRPDLRESILGHFRVVYLLRAPAEPQPGRCPIGVGRRPPDQKGRWNNLGGGSPGFRPSA